MKIKIKRIDASLPLPEYKTKGAVAFDIYSRTNEIVKPLEIKYLPSNLIIQVPKGYFLMIAARSSTHKKGLFMAHGIGVLDQDYCGPEDEIFIPLYNFTKKKVMLEKGERIAQGILTPLQKAQWHEVSSIAKKSRGGFGSTGE
ncbi:MAG: dUTP diphosphatase [bacterium]|nr:dUTP diphosphatase [bacterium]